MSILKTKMAKMSYREYDTLLTEQIIVGLDIEGMTNEI